MQKFPNKKKRMQTFAESDIWHVRKTLKRWNCKLPFLKQENSKQK